MPKRLHFLAIIGANLLSNTLMFAVMAAARAQWLNALFAEKVVIGLAIINIGLIGYLLATLFTYVNTLHRLNEPKNRP
ncbi:hypothetical protein [Lacticaseibacillus porcinae]|uniref:hypothetical protein n=1 Tax=Lacticaseibacillus porcinae TaxID=1123687 RepID=UPI000F7B4825|nr:hypothetical protein [Lacticaseibacillus porcinae]